jgi:hypothetical protein
MRHHAARSGSALESERWGCGGYLSTTQPRLKLTSHSKSLLFLAPTLARLCTAVVWKRVKCQSGATNSTSLGAEGKALEQKEAGGGVRCDCSSCIAGRNTARRSHIKFRISTQAC